MHGKYVESLRETFPEGLDKIQGAILWGLLVNSNVYTPDGVEVGASFRGTGKVIADLVGEGNYLDYYMADSFTKEILRIIGADPQKVVHDLKKRLTEAGWKITSIAPNAVKPEGAR